MESDVAHATALVFGISIALIIVLGIIGTARRKNERDEDRDGPAPDPRCTQTPEQNYQQWRRELLDWAENPSEAGLDDWLERWRIYRHDKPKETIVKRKLHWVRRSIWEKPDYGSDVNGLFFRAIESTKLVDAEKQSRLIAAALLVDLHGKEIELTEAQLFRVREAKLSVWHNPIKGSWTVKVSE